MRLKNGGKYYIENGSLLIVVNRIKYRDPDFRYCKVNISIFNKTETIFYETIRNQKLYLDKINHWKIEDN